MTRSEIFSAITKERKRQDKLHPEWYPGLALAVLAEEVGEVASAWTCAQIEKNPEHVQMWKRELEKELVQVAAVCVRWLEDIESQCDRRIDMLERLADTVRVYRVANYEARAVLENEIDRMLSELGVGLDASAQEERTT